MGRWDKITRELVWQLIENSKDLTLLTYTVEPSCSAEILEFKKVLDSICRNSNLHSIHLNVLPSSKDAELVNTIKQFQKINPFRIFKVLK